MSDTSKRSLVENGTDEGDAGQMKKPRIVTDEIEGNEMRDESAGESTTKLPEAKEERIKRRKVVLLLSYSGWGYLGMQRNPDAKTIEGDLLQAMKSAGVITEEHYDKPQKMLFQRAARTDKGVSAVKQVVSLKLPEDANIENINRHLPEQIRVICMKRTTKGFNSKVNCDARTYSYVLPTYAFSPVDSDPIESFRILEKIVERVNSILKIYVGTHNFHNFTLKRNFKDASSKRFMHSFSCGMPFVRDDIEYIVLTVKGQSFMQHHIRKMIGLAIAVARGYTTESTIVRAFGNESLDIPKAPGLGLMLEEVHYERYNNRYGSDGIHEKLDWTEHEEFIKDFKEKYILSNILKVEKEEKPMLAWLATLPGHSYSVREDRPPTVVKKEVESSDTKGDMNAEVGEKVTEETNNEIIKNYPHVNGNCSGPDIIVPVESS